MFHLGVSGVVLAALLLTIVSVARTTVRWSSSSRRRCSPSSRRGSRGWSPGTVPEGPPGPRAVRRRPARSSSEQGPGPAATTSCRIGSVRCDVVVDRTLDRVEIEGYKSIRRCDLKFRPLNVLVGPNGAGKSNFVGAFGLLGAIVRGRLQVSVAEAGGAAPMFFGDPARTEHIRLHLDFGVNGYEAELGTAPTIRCSLQESIAVSWGLKGDPRGKSRRGWCGVPSPVCELRSRPVQFYCYNIMSGWGTYQFHDTSRTAALKRKQKVDDNIRLRENASNLAPFLFRLKQSDQDSYRRIVSTVRLVAPFLEDFVLIPDRINPEVIQLEWRHVAIDAYFDARALSDGTLRFICLATLLLQPDPPSVIVIDEPELGLHPFAITQLADLFRAVTTQDRQILVSTQSVTLLNQLNPQDVIVTEQKAARRSSSGWILTG